MNTRRIILAAIFGAATIVYAIRLVKYYRERKAGRRIEITILWLYVMFFALLTLDNIFEFL